MDILIPFLITAVVIGGVLLGTAVLITRFYRKVDQGQALIINKLTAEPTVTFTGGVVIPIIYRAEVMDISVKTMEIARRGQEGLICKDNIRADIKVTFFVRVNKTTEDVLKVAQAIGCVRASDQKTLEELFVAKFSEALKTVGKRLEFEELYTQRDHFKDQIIEVIGRDLNGYVLEDAAIDYLEQTPMELLDAANILDSQGIRKITEITAQQNVRTNDLRQTERKELARQNLEADEAILELEKRRADATARQQREILSIQAREQAEANKVQAEERQKAETARIKSNEEIELADISRSRQVETAEKDKERVLGIKTEQVDKDRQLEAISRERAVELQRIDKEKALEVEKKHIADVVRARIVVDKSVAEEEERIKTLRTTEAANRHKIEVVTHATAEAEEGLIKEIKAAEAQEKKAEHKGRERLILASAELEAADKEAQAKMRMAEGVQAESAAVGLAGARVREADAVAYEKTGMAEARVTREKMEAEAAGTEKKGLAAAKVREAAAIVEEKEGMVRATVTLKQGEAAADVTRGTMIAQAAGNEAHAAALEKTAVAEGRVIAERMAAEAGGIAAKVSALQGMEGAAREHEEFRLNLDKSRAVDLAALETRKEIAHAQATVLAAAYSSADIKIIGGDKGFVDTFTAAAGMGHSAEGFLGQSDQVKGLIGQLASNPGSGELLSSATLAMLLGRLLDGATGKSRDQIAELLEKAREAGIADKPLR